MNRLAKRSWRTLAPYIVQQWRTLALIAVLTLIGAAGTALQPWPLKILVDYALAAEPVLLPPLFENLSPLWLIAAAAIASLCLFALSEAVSCGLAWAWTVAGQRMVRALALDVFSRLQRLSLIFHSRNSVGDSLSRLTGDTWCVYTLTGTLASPGTQLATLLTVGVISWRLHPDLALLSFSTAPLLAVASYYFGRKLKNRARKSRDTESRLMSFVQQTLSAIPLVQAFGSEQRNSRRFQSIAADAVLISQRSALVSSTYWLTSGVISSLGAAIVMYAGARQVMAGQLTIGSLLVFLAYLRSMQLAVEALIQSYSALKPVEASIDRVMEILAAHDSDVTEIPRARALDLVGSGISVSIENVTFGYEEGRRVLHNVSLTARPNSVTAVVGATGAGKSTLVSLIPRFFDPWSGRVTIDGLDIRQVQIASLRQQIALVLQEPFLFRATVADNIAYGRPGAADHEIVAAAQAANADRFIRQLPDGYETVLGGRGCTLSGGERQRINIARALLKNAPILILDEPTSALDSHTEAAILEALQRLIKGRTTIVIAHRLSTIRSADQIVILDAGRIVESGAPDELLNQGGAYHRLHSLQVREELIA